MKRAIRITFTDLDYVEQFAFGTESQIREAFSEGKMLDINGETKYIVYIQFL